MRASSINLKRYWVLIFCVVFLIAIFVLVFLWQNLGRKEKPAPDYKKMGLAYYRQGYFEEARSELQLGVKSNTSDAEIYYVLGKSCAYLGETEDALAYYEKAAKLDPKDVELRYTLALAYKNAGQKQRAFDELKESLELFPGFLGSRIALIDFYAGDGDIDQVTTQLRRIEQTNVSISILADIHVRLGGLYFDRGQKAAAQNELEKALELDPRNQQAQQLLRKLSVRLPPPSADALKRISRSLNSKITSPAQDETLTGIGCKITGTAQSGKGYVTKVEVSVDGGNTWLEAVNQGKNFSEWIWQWSLPAEDARTYTIKSRATDNFFNIEYPGDEIKITVDTVAPTTIASIKSPQKVNKKAVGDSVVVLSTPKDSDIVFYRWNNDSYQVYSSALKVPAKKNTLYYYSKDSAGNVEREQKRHITVSSQ